MKILHCVEFYHPSVGGAQEVVKQLSEHLVQFGHEVTVATTKLGKRTKKNIHGVNVIGLDISGNATRGYQGKDIAKYKELLVNPRYDIIMSYAAQQWTTDLMLEVIDQIKAKTILVPCGYSSLHDPAYKDYFHKLPDLLRQFSATIYLSNDYRDINYAKDHKLDNIIIIPNGADEKEFQFIDKKGAKKLRTKYGINQDETFILNVSNHTGAKGHSETINAFIQSDITDATLMFIGDMNKHSKCYKSCTRKAWINNYLVSKLKKNNKRIIVASMNREQTVTAFQACDIFLFLSNIECSPLVLFESAAASKPFISSNCGNASEIANWTKSGLIVKSKQDGEGHTKVDIKDAARILTNLVGNPKLAKTIGISGRKNWLKKYTWEIITQQYISLYKKL